MHPSFAHSEGLTYTVILQTMHAHTSSHAQQSTHAHKHKQYESHCANKLRSGGQLRPHFPEFSIIAQCLLHRLCQIIASFLHFSRENESIPWELSSRAGLCNPERQTLAKTLASDPGNGLSRFMPDLNKESALTRSPNSPTSG